MEVRWWSAMCGGAPHARLLRLVAPDGRAPSAARAPDSAQPRCRLTPRDIFRSAARPTHNIFVAPLCCIASVQHARSPDTREGSLSLSLSLSLSNTTSSAAPPGPHTTSSAAPPGPHTTQNIFRSAARPTHPAAASSLGDSAPQAAPPVGPVGPASGRTPPQQLPLPAPRSPCVASRNSRGRRRPASPAPQAAAPVPAACSALRHTAADAGGLSCPSSRRSGRRCLLAAQHAR